MTVRVGQLRRQNLIGATPALSCFDKLLNSSLCSLKVALAALLALIIYKVSTGKKSRSGQQSQGRSGASSQDRKKGRGNVDELFWIRIKKLVKIVLPSYTCREARYIYILSVLLVVRTLMSIWLADVNGRVVKAIVNKSLPEFLQKVSSR